MSASQKLLNLKLTLAKYIICCFLCCQLLKESEFTSFIHFQVLSHLGYRILVSKFTWSSYVLLTLMFYSLGIALCLFCFTHLQPFFSFLRDVHITHRLQRCYLSPCVGASSKKERSLKKLWSVMRACVRACVHCSINSLRSTVCWLMFVLLYMFCLRRRRRWPGHQLNCRYY